MDYRVFTRYCQVSRLDCQHNLRIAITQTKALWSATADDSTSTPPVLLRLRGHDGSGPHDRERVPHRSRATVQHHSVHFRYGCRYATTRLRSAAPELSPWIGVRLAVLPVMCRLADRNRGAVQIPSHHSPR